ncbi:MtrB/PioB family outer membrane beta-barrel protein, partial [Thermodesulfobacteriota bacterium]
PPPTECILSSLTVNQSFIYGMDNFDNSSLGLLEDRHHILSFDVDYAVNERIQVQAFYGYEKYKNVLAGNGLAGAVIKDWFTVSEDKIHSVGGGLKVGLINDKMDLDVSYSYSKVDGNIHFFTPGGGFADFNTVDATRYHQFEAKLRYAHGKHWEYTLGYLLENFDYDDFNKEGFVHVPADNNGLYQGALLMGILPDDYNVNIFYLKLSYRF